MQRTSIGGFDSPCATIAVSCFNFTELKRDNVDISAKTQSGQSASQQKRKRCNIKFELVNNKLNVI